MCLLREPICLILVDNKDHYFYLAHRHPSYAELPFPILDSFKPSLFENLSNGDKFENTKNIYGDHNLLNLIKLNHLKRLVQPLCPLKIEIDLDQRFLDSSKYDCRKLTCRKLFYLLFNHF